MIKVLSCIFAVGLPLFSVAGFSMLGGGDVLETQTSPLYRHAIETSAEGQSEVVVSIEKSLASGKNAQYFGANGCGRLNEAGNKS